MAVSFIGGGNRNTQKKPPLSQVTDKLYPIIWYRGSRKETFSVIYALHPCLNIPSNVPSFPMIIVIEEITCCATAGDIVLEYTTA